MAKEKTLAIIKPDAVSGGNIGAIVSMIEKNGFAIMGMVKTALSKKQAQDFYAVHRGKPFYASLVDYMSSGPIVVMGLEKEGAIQAWRDLMGSTNPASAALGTIRKMFGTSIEANAVHGSDAAETAASELAFFFGA